MVNCEQYSGNAAVIPTGLIQDDTLPASNTQVGVSNLTSGTSLSSMCTMFVYVTAANASFSLTGTAGSTVPTYADLYIVQLPFQSN